MTTPGAASRCGVLGEPIGHSLSPVLHRAAYAALGLDWEYDAYRVNADELTAFVGGLGASWRGLSLTRPLKQVAAGLCDTVEPLARRLNSVNTLVRTAAGWSGHNTDIGGCVDAVRAAGVPHVTTGVIVGAGATAASGLAAMAELGVARVEVLARSVERAGGLIPLGEGLGIEVRLRALEDLPSGGEGAPRADLLLSTIPAAAQQPWAGFLAAMADVVFDVNYEPRVTPVIEAAGKRDALVVPGVDLLLHQAARQVVLMTGSNVAPLSAMRDALDQ